MSRLKSYTVVFQDTLRIRVSVEATDEPSAQEQARSIWSNDLWGYLEPALQPTQSEILESCDRDFFDVEEDLFTTPIPNESTTNAD